MESSSRALLQDLVNHFSQVATSAEMTMVAETVTKEEDIVVVSTEKTNLKSATNLRTASSGGFLQYILYTDTSCTALSGVVDVALNVCVPYTNAFLGSHYVFISTSGSIVNINGYSDSACTINIGSISADTNTGSTCSVSNSGTSSSRFSVSTSTTLPIPPFPAGSSYLSAK